MHICIIIIFIIWFGSGAPRQTGGGVWCRLSNVSLYSVDIVVGCGATAASWGWGNSDDAEGRKSYDEDEDEDEAEDAEEAKGGGEDEEEDTSRCGGQKVHHHHYHHHPFIYCPPLLLHPHLKPKTLPVQAWHNRRPSSYLTSSSLLPPTRPQITAASARPIDTIQPPSAHGMNPASHSPRSSRHRITSHHIANKQAHSSPSVSMSARAGLAWPGATFTAHSPVTYRRASHHACLSVGVLRCGIAAALLWYDSWM
ncbi:hypothetical protein BKA80DRAFT_287103 [Phyllosticta citrichinensis]